MHGDGNSAARVVLVFQTA